MVSPRWLVGLVLALFAIAPAHGATPEQQAQATWRLLDEALGRGLAGQIASLGVALALGAAVYGIAITLLRIPEASQIWGLARRR